MIDYFLSLSLPSSKSTFPQPFKEKCISEVVRIGSIIIFIWVSYEKEITKFSLLFDVIFVGRPQGEFEVDHS